ncbi:MAG: superoxide dismutase [Verrucomicrobia bacterium]|nr:superoxide dismutase [Cytophagales bacterium]
MKNRNFLLVSLFCLLTNFSLPIFSQTAATTPKFTLPALPYAYEALEPYFDKQTMEIHHTKHHQTYITNLIKAIDEKKDPKVSAASLADLLAQAGKMPIAIRNNAGGHYNHSLFWTILAPPAAENKATGELERMINAKFGSMDKFKEEFAKAATTRFGSGWAWLVVTSKKELMITSTANQDNPLMDIAEVKGVPIMGLDVWEHAYYLKYQNKRADYIAAFWSVLNWKEVSKRYEEAVKNK